MPDQPRHRKSAPIPLQKSHTNDEDGSMQGAQPRHHVDALSRVSVETVRNHLTAVEFEHLHSRVIALESLMIALLAGASEKQLSLASQMAIEIYPQPGFTEHSSTIKAANQIVQLIERANHFQGACDI